MNSNIVEVRLSPEAALYREKLLLRTRNDIREDLVPLPSFGLALPLQKGAEDFDRLVLKQFLKLFVYPLALDRNPEGLTDFVTLVIFSLKDEKIEMTLYCPFPELVAQAKETVETRGKWQEKDEALGRSGIDIRFEFALIDSITPVVYMYRPAEKLVLLTNRNHFGDPEQFISPKACGTTSGFLNFLGALVLHDMLNDPGPRLRQLVTEANTGSNAGIDEWLRWFYHFTETQTIWSPSSIYVYRDNPERYIYEFSAE